MIQGKHISELTIKELRAVAPKYKIDSTLPKSQLRTKIHMKMIEKSVQEFRERHNGI